MCEEYIDKPLYLLIADWMMAQNRWITAREISVEFDIEHRKAINTLSYILAEVGEIECEIKMIPNKLSGRGCQCQRLVKVKKISSSLYSRLRTTRLTKEVVCNNAPRLNVVPPGELNREQKWQWMLSKSLRR
jgi:transcriptional activator CaiF